MSDDNDREALAQAIDPEAHRLNWYADAKDVRDQMDGLRIKRSVYSQVDRILAALPSLGYVKQGPITDAQVEAAFRSWNGMHVGTVRDRLRAALEAAREA